MRLRNVPGAREIMIENEFVFTEPENMAGTWKEVFGNNNPVRIEIGMGKGRFITTLAQMNPDINYIGIEKYSSVLLRAVEKQDELRLANLRFIRMASSETESVLDIRTSGDIPLRRLAQCYTTLASEAVAHGDDVLADTYNNNASEYEKQADNWKMPEEL